MNYEVLIGDCRKTLKELEASSVHCVITSPPYYGLRDYGTAEWEGGDPSCEHSISMPTEYYDPKRGKKVLRPEGAHRGGSSSRCHKCGATRIDQQIGLEDDAQEYIDGLVEVGREIRRVLRDDGTFWLNLGDTYGQTGPRRKQLYGIPWKVAFALQDDGWYLRQSIIWSKPSCMPESVQDRCTRSHENIFMLTKKIDYYYDHEAIKEPIADSSVGRQKRGVSDFHKNIDGAPGQTPHTMSKARQNDPDREIGITRNKRSVWVVSTKAFRGAHFAVFPPDLIEPCILAGTSAKGCCSLCGAPWKRVVAKGERVKQKWGEQTKVDDSRNDAEEGSGLRTGMVNTYYTEGWRPDCECFGKLVKREVVIPPSMTPEEVAQTKTMTVYESELPLEEHPIKPCVVLDPFGGSGTTAAVAIKYGRDAVLCELNPEYAELIPSRIQSIAEVAQVIDDERSWL